jgi:hypothetical protein
VTDDALTRLLAEKVMGWPVASSPRLAEWGSVALRCNASGEWCLIVPTLGQEGKLQNHARSTTAARAICLAALRAVGQEIPNA